MVIAFSKEEIPKEVNNNQKVSNCASNTSNVQHSFSKEGQPSSIGKSIQVRNKSSHSNSRISFVGVDKAGQQSEHQKSTRPIQSVAKPKNETNLNAGSHLTMSKSAKGKGVLHVSNIMPTVGSTTKPMQSKE